MGLLDDAIREHLDLKRRRGADPTEIERAERDALGPVRRGPEGSNEADVAYDHEAPAHPQHAVAEYEPHDLEEPDPHGFEEPDAFQEPSGFEEPPRFAEPPAAEPPPASSAAAAPQPPVDLGSGPYHETEVWDSLEPDAPHMVDAAHRAS